MFVFLCLFARLCVCLFARLQGHVLRDRASHKKNQYLWILLLLIFFFHLPNEKLWDFCLYFWFKQQKQPCKRILYYYYYHLHHHHYIIYLCTFRNQGTQGQEVLGKMNDLFLTFWVPEIM